MEYILSKDKLEELLKNLGHEAFKRDFVNDRRCSGRTTAILIDIIATAMKNPKKKVYIYDHYMDKPHQKRILLAIIGNIINKLDLHGFDLHFEQRPYITFQPYEVEPKSLLKGAK